MDSDGYFFTIDDDLIYPPYYSEYMINMIELYGRKSIVTLHGRSFSKFPIKGYYKDSSLVNHFSQEQKNPVKVQFGGTGVMAFHTDLLKVDITYFNHPNMADIWIGKYAYENDIDIMCVNRTSHFVKQQNIVDSIFTNESKKDEVQTQVVNDTFMSPTVSIIIPTYNNVSYIDECIESIIKSCEDIAYEILIGIDGCEETLNHIQGKVYNQYTKFFYFNKNNGPYVIKNTLAKLSKTKDYLLFFDSDDVMKNNMVDGVIQYLKLYDCVKPMYHNFRGELNTGLDKYKRNSGLWGEGVFGVHKNIFLKLNGFEPWICAADSEFMIRLSKNSVKTKQTDELMFYRRVHEYGLTSMNRTGHGSELRKKYVALTNEKTNFGPLRILNVGNYIPVVCATNIVLNENYVNTDFVTFDSLLKQIEINNLLSGINYRPIKTDSIDYKRINEIMNANKPKPNNPPVKVIQNKPENRKELIRLKKDSVVAQSKRTMGVRPTLKNMSPHVFGGKNRQ